MKRKTSRLEQPPRPPPVEGEKRQGPEKRPKNAQLTFTQELRIGFVDPPSASVSKGYEEYVVQELVMHAEATRYLRERIVTLEGESLLAPLPADVLPGKHFGPNLIAYILHQYHHNHVTQPLLLYELQQKGFAISAGQISHIFTEDNRVFHEERAEVLAAGLARAAYIQVDDAVARHQGQNGYCTHIGNALFAYFASTDSKSMVNSLEVPRGQYSDYAIDDAATAYWRTYGLSAALIASLSEGPAHFAGAAAWQARLKELGVTGVRLVRIAMEGALLGSLMTPT